MNAGDSFIRETALPFTALFEGAETLHRQYGDSVDNNNNVVVSLVVKVESWIR